MFQRLAGELENWTDSGSEQGHLYCWHWPLRGHMLLQRKNIVFANFTDFSWVLIAQKDPGSKGNLELISLISGSVGSSLLGRNLFLFNLGTLGFWLRSRLQTVITVLLLAFGSHCSDEISGPWGIYNSPHLSAVSSYPGSSTVQNIKWKNSRNKQLLSFKLHAVLSSMMKSHVLCLGYDLSPFVQNICTLVLSGILNSQINSITVCVFQ